MSEYKFNLWVYKSSVWSSVTIYTCHIVTIRFIFVLVLYMYFLENSLNCLEELLRRLTADNNSLQIKSILDI